MKMLAVLLSSLFLFPVSVLAENSTKANGYTIHHNAFTTDTLPKGVANAYNIQRSKGRAMVNISIIKDKADTTGTAVQADVNLKAKNLFGQTRAFEVREIREANAIYYIADFAVANREQLVFEIQAMPTGEHYALQAKFQHEFFTE